MPTFHYRALTQIGEVVSGSISAPTAAEVERRVEYLGLIPIEAIVAQGEAKLGEKIDFSFFSRARAEDVTTFTGDLALLLRTGARINDALDLLASDPDIGRMRSTIGKIAASILSGESFAEALSHHPRLFPAIYLALVRVGETSGTLVPILEATCTERRRAEALRRRIVDMLRYPAFLLIAASGVLAFFLVVVLPQFANVFRDFNAKLDPALTAFVATSDFVCTYSDVLFGVFVCALLAGWLLLRRPAIRHALIEGASKLPLIRSIMGYRRTALFCRNLSLLLAAGSTLPASLRILSDIMVTSGNASIWTEITDKVRQGGKLSDALATMHALPPMAIRTLRLGEDSGQLASLAERIAEFYEVKLQRSIDRLMGVVGPAAILGISIIVGGLIVSIMTALLSVNQIVG
jgi:general secretion pathway protein F